MPKKVKLKCGDVVRVEWNDAVTFSRVEADPADVPLPRFETWASVGHIEAKKLVLIHEREMTEPMGGAKKRTIEPTAIPRGMVTKVFVYRLVGEARLP